MVTAKEIIDQLKTLGSESIKKVLIKHGAKEPFYGVKVEELKKIEKKIKKDYALSLALYDSGISDAMYLAGLISDPMQMTKKNLQKWGDKAYWYMLSECTVAWTAAESKYGWELAMEWINSGKEHLQASGWSTLSSLIGIKPDNELDLKQIKSLLDRVEKDIHSSPNRTRYTMNGFVIAVGSNILFLTDDAIATAKKIGQVTVDMGATACKVPFAPDYINKVKERGNLGKKRKTAKC